MNSSKNAVKSPHKHVNDRDLTKIERTVRYTLCDLIYKYHSYYN